MPWGYSADQCWSSCRYYFRELLLIILIMYDICICWHFFVHAPLLLRDADILITCDWVMVISGPYICSVSVPVYYILGTTSRPVGVAYHCLCLCTSHYCFLVILLLLLLDISRWSFGWCDLYWYLYVLIGGWDWPGVGFWSTYMYCMLVSYHSAPRPYIRTGWSVVR